MRTLFALALIAAAPAVGPRYGETLLRQAPGHVPIRIEARGKTGAPIVVGPATARGATVPLTDAMGEPIGSVTMAGSPARARRVAAWLSRRIYVADNLAEPDPFVPGAQRAPRAQALVEQMLARFPDLVTLALHVAPPAGDNIIAASSFGRIGKAPDKDDLHVEQDGAVLREVTNGGARLAVELPLNDRNGHAIGALSTSFRVPAGADPETFYARAVVVRDAMARQIHSRAALFAP